MLYFSRCDYPNIEFHLFSGDSGTISERLDKGLIDFGIFIEPFDLSKYTTGNSNLCFRPLYPELISHLDMAWKKNQVFPRCAEIFLKRLQETL